MECDCIKPDTSCAICRTTIENEIYWIEKSEELKQEEE